MLRPFIGLMSLTVALIPISAQAFPTSPQINKLAQRICQLPSQSPEMFQESMIREMIQEMGGWMNQGNLSLEEMNDKDTLVKIGNEVALEMYEICPNRVMEIGNQLSNGAL
ncbi:glutamyl-tRNA amidotransferase [Crocosphaera sp.]|uniref:glutamyl-tRNA amidotransferase n=1 Tax=Crocosphaera sp. TaxID=2729996 RepID=UPI003F228A4A|nr:glutamyl-tRNA amidotransferase [Crocosphaera sp.]